MQIGEFAIIGMACRVPLGDNISDYWSNIIKGNSIFERTYEMGDRKLLRGNIQYNFNYFKNKKIYEKQHLMDPQLKVLLEICYETLQDAFGSDEYREKRVGVFVSSGPSYKWKMHIDKQVNLSKEEKEWANINCDEQNYASLCSYYLDLKGPCMMVNASCNSSFVAIQTAIQYLNNEECDLALIGGVSIESLNETYDVIENNMFSKSGVCTVCSKNSDGTVPSNGCGGIIIKKRKNAEMDKNRIYAVIAGCEVENHGYNKNGFSIMDTNAMFSVINMVHKKTSIPPQKLSFIELHAVGTLIGDALEVSVMKEVFSESQGNCALGSNKANIGFLGVAAGMLSLIKAILSLINHKYPYMANLENISSLINLKNSPLFINQKVVILSENEPIYCGVNCYAEGGSYGYIILKSI